jgi:hypothetical protein
MYVVPILLLGYNRPDYLVDRLQELRKIAPPLIYISIDGSNDVLTDEITEALSTNLKNWPSDSRVEIWRNKDNLGLTKHVPRAITRVLREHLKVIIVEDDISLSPNFYINMIKGFETLASNDIKGTVGAFSPLKLPRNLESLNRWRTTHYFSCWGWGVSREIWRKYKVDLRNEDIDTSLAKSQTYKNLTTAQQTVWRERFQKIVLHPFDTWDVQVQYMSFKYDFTNILPVSRFIDNVGFSDNRSVHTKGKKPRWFQSGGYSNAIINLSSVSPISKILTTFIDSNTFIGDSKLFQWWNIRKL